MPLQRHHTSKEDDMRLPVFQFALGAIVVLVGAYLIGRWAVGVALGVIGMCMIADALLRDVKAVRPQPTATTFEEVIERAKAADVTR
jgi:hypothetical protein